MSRLRRFGEQVVGLTELVPPGGAGGDGHGRLLTANAQLIFESKNTHDGNSTLWEENVVGGGTATFDYNKAAMALAVGTTSGDVAERQSAEFIPYTPGKVQSFGLTWIMNTPKANLRQEVGAGYVQDGLFFRMDGLTPQFVLRSSVSGTPVETTYTRDLWTPDPSNPSTADPLDGTGPSGVTLDVTKIQLLMIRYLWQGAGFFQFGFKLDGEDMIVHTVNVGNEFSEPFMRQPSLPTHYRIENTGTTASASTMYEVCTEASSEGGAPKVGFSYSSGSENAAGAPLAVTTSTTQKVLHMVRLKQTLPSAAENRVTAKLLQGSVYIAGNDSRVHVYHVHDPRYTMNIGTVTGGPLVVGETLTGGTSGATATLITDNTTSLVYRETGQTGSFVAGETVTGGTSGATFAISTNGVTVWKSIDATSACEFAEVNATTQSVTPAMIQGAHMHAIDTDFIPTSQGNKGFTGSSDPQELDRHNQIHQNYDSSNSAVFAITVTTLTGVGTAYGAITQLELD